jgi:two-component system, cell cycle sensor histidine kinase and response regulator CckA
MRLRVPPCRLRSSAPELTAMRQSTGGGRAQTNADTLLRRLGQVLHRLVACSGAIEDVADRERAELLASLLLALFGLGLASGLVQWLLIPNFWPTFAAMLGALAVIGAAYFASRSRHFRKAAWAAAVAPIVACAVVAWNDPKDAVSGAFMLIGVLLATLFLGARSALQLACAAFLALVAALAPWSAAFDPGRAVPLLAFHAILSPLLIIAAAHRDRIEELRKDALERKQAELHEARQMELLGRLASGVAHDFNNLLTVVIGNTEILNRLGDERMRVLTADIGSAAARGAGLTRQLLTTARRQILRPRNVDLSALLHEVQGLLRRLIGTHIVLLVELEDELPAVLADPSQLEQVILNLALNGRDAMPQGGTLRIAVSRVAPCEVGSRASWVCISVADTGVGMDPETQEQIFKAFFTTKGASGHGLGLATVRGIVEQSGGRIEVTSAPQRGSRFSIHLPVAVAGEAPSSAASMHVPSRSQRSRKTSILVVEDEALVRRAVEHMLRSWDYSVLSVSTGVEAMEIFERERGHVDLLLCDVMIPGMPGLELAQRLRQEKESLRVLFMSGEGSRAMEAVLALPDASLIAKPFAGEELRQMIERMLGRRLSLEVASAPVA